MTEEETEDYTVLVVEDDPNHQLLIRKALTAEGLPFSLVQFARDSHDAERFAKQLDFDVLLFDNRIPGRRGLDLIGYLREEGIEGPFVLMTSAGTEDLVVQAYRKKVSEYVIKEPGFWKEVPQILLRVIREEKARQRERRLKEQLMRTNERLDKLNTEVQLQNTKLSGLLDEIAKELKEPLEALADETSGAVKAKAKALAETCARILAAAE